jgi:hypothetical protein
LSADYTSTQSFHFFFLHSWHATCKPAPLRIAMQHNDFTESSRQKKQNSGSHYIDSEGNNKDTIVDFLRQYSSQLRQLLR